MEKNYHMSMHVIIKDMEVYPSGYAKQSNKTNLDLFRIFYHDRKLNEFLAELKKLMEKYR